MITFQENTHFSQALPCTKEEFWAQVRKSSTGWRIDARRAILAAVEASKTLGVAALQTWLDNADYQKFLLKKQNLKKKTAKEAWAKKTDADKLLAFAQELKENLPAFIFSCREFDATKTGKGKPFCHRRLADCHLNGLFMLDIDHVENPMQIWYKLREDEELMKKIVLVHITSSSFGIRIVGEADVNIGNLADNQIIMASRLGYKADDSCIDATRNSFAPKEEDILYINEEKLFDYYDEEFDKRFTPLYREKKTQPLHHQFAADDRADGGVRAKTAAVASKDAQQGAGNERTVDVQSSRLSEAHGEISPLTTFGRDDKGEETHGMTRWRGYDLQSIIDARYADKLPCKADSNRHTESLKLATDLMLMLDGDKATVQRIVEAQSWVQEIIEERNENVEQTVESAAGCIKEKEKKYAGTLPSKAMLEAVKTATGLTYQEIVKGVKETGRLGPHDITSSLEKWGAEIEAMFEDYPMLRDVCTGLKRSQYPAAMFVAGGCMMTLMTRCWYRFYHRPQNERRLNCSLYIIGHPASNKSMADDICEVLMTPVVDADKAGKAALNRYKKDTKKKAANKEGKDKPQVIIREHPSRTSNGQMIEDMLNAKEIVDGKEVQLHMFTFDTELDNSITLQSGGSWINKQAMELKAFHNEKDGQMYQNSDSPVDEFRVTWNYIYTGTPIALKKKVNEKNFGSGLSTRLTVIPMPKTNFEMIDFEEKTTIDWQRLERMKTWAFKLDTRAGELPLWPLVKQLYQWTKNRMADCAEDESEANELMLKRVPYHALNFAAPFIDMRHWEHIHQQGKYWEGEYEVDETDWKLCELIARIQYATQQHFFGVLAEKYFDDMNNDVQISGKRHQQKSVDGFNRLPDVFTKEDVIRCFGYKPESTACFMKIKRMIEDNFAEKIEEGDDTGKYRKLNQMLI
ncbi:hypothetical protein SAMN04487902_106123 [Prevotella sp. ne3005]|uniref:BT4734/BF3469 family protein n=1 Tax=Prevotella sp. ne3005 TaxID=1761887 RepID=UPI0008CD5F8B|nr:BT4734/BF3469 family protein [Prevotella sp. ne3005]SEN04536.1 hypothetical protein SAMN04487902_106123 [Prevotella sp. ne3005]